MLAEYLGLFLLARISTTMVVYPVVIFVSFWFAGDCSLPRPVMIYPGLFNPGKFIDQTCNYILQSYPDATCIFVEPEGPIYNLLALETVVQNYCEASLPYFETYPDGVDLIGFSIGGLIADGVIKTCNHTIKTFINAAGPINGIFGIPSPFDAVVALGLLPYIALTNSKISKAMYTPLLQNSLSAANMWHDPTDPTAFLKGNIYLPKYNNLLPLPCNEERKNNYLKLCNVVLMVGADDNTIIPRTSALGGYFDTSGTTLMNLETQTMYINDTYGLQTMMQRGDLKRVVIPGVNHFTINQIFSLQNFVLPNLVKVSCK